MATKGAAWTMKELVRVLRDRCRWFTGSSCGGCHKTANVIDAPGWFCPCGCYNTLLLDQGEVPHEAPDVDPSRGAILQVIETARGPA